MKRLAPIFIAVAISALLVPMTSAQTPRVLRHKHFDQYLWISEAEALDGKGNLRMELFGPYAGALQRNLSANEHGGCREFMTQPRPASFGNAPNATLADASRNARAIVVGTVVSSGQGFYHAIPGTLLSVRVIEDAAKAESPGAGSCETLYVFVPAAKILTTGGVICSRPLGDLPLPVAGDRLMAFSYYAPADEPGFVVPVDAENDLLIERDGQPLFVPERLKSEVGARNVNALARVVRAYRENRVK